MSKKKTLILFLISSFLSVSLTSFSQEGSDYIVHIIKHGEVPSVLAKKYNVSLSDLESLNKWGPKVILHVGDKVKLPLGAHLSATTDSVKPAAPVVAVVPAEEPKSKAAPATITPVKPGADTGTYVMHTVQHGEVPSVLARKYNVNVDELKKINDWTPKTIWHVGDKVKLPRSVQTVQVSEPAKTVIPAPLKTGTVVADTTAKAVTVAAPQAGYQSNYTVQKKETLYSIGKKFKVTPDQIKTWNNMPGNNISEGQVLILYTATPVAQPAQEVQHSTAAPASPQPQPVVESKPVAPPAAAVTVTPQKPKIDSAATSVSPEGYFAPLFGKDITGKNLQVTNGVAMTFKTASGWTDKKYYVLMNDVAPGSVVKITGTDGKSVYAKILWNMGDAQDNEGLNFRISDAAASALDIKDLKFQLTVTYYR